MGVEEFDELQRLIGRPYTPDGPAFEARPWDPDAWEATNRRFAELVDVWFHQPLIEAGFRGKAPRWVFGRRAVRPVLDLRRHRGAQLEQGLIDFTAEWAIWVEGFARRVSRAKRLTPQTSQSPFVGRLGWFIGTGDYDVWWVVTPERVVRKWPVREEPQPPSANDEVPAILRSKVIPMLTSIDTVVGSIEAIERWRGSGWESVMHWWDDPLDALREIARQQLGDEPSAPTEDRGE